MSSIKFIPFGGINERGKNCYILEINNEIIIINSGTLIPNIKRLGIEQFIPDFTWLEANKERIRGICIGNPANVNIGSLVYLCNAIPNITIYTNEFSKEVILNKFENHYLVKNKQVHFYISILKAGIPQNIGSIVTIPFRVTSTFPQSLGFIFKINDENIIYIDDFIVSSNKNILFYNQMYFINALTGSKNTILLCNVGNVGNYTGFTSPKYQILAEIENIFLDSKGRIIFALYDEDIYRLVTILKITIESERPIYFLSDYTRNVAESIMKNNFSGSNLKFLELNEVIKSKNSVIVISSPIEDIFNDIISFFSEWAQKNFSENDQINFCENDIFVFVSNVVNGYERKKADMLSEIKKNNLINIHDINDKFLPLKASNEDHKFLVSFLHPKYIIPHSGLYMDFVNYKQAIKLTGFKLENVSLLKNNGTIIEFNNGELINQNEKIELQTKIINSYGTYDNSTSSILERNQMKENGIVIVNFSIDPNKLEIRDYKYNIIGVSGEENNHSKIKDLEDEINGKVNVIFKEELSKEPFNIKEIKNKIKRIILKKIGNIFDKEPIVLTTILYNKITIED